MTPLNQLQYTHTSMLQVVHFI